MTPNSLLDVPVTMDRNGRSRSPKYAINPIQARQVVKLKAAVNTGDTFRETALEWFDKHHTRWSGQPAFNESSQHCVCWPSVAAH